MAGVNAFKGSAELNSAGTACVTTFYPDFLQHCSPFTCLSLTLLRENTRLLMSSFSLLGCFYLRIKGQSLKAVL